MCWKWGKLDSPQNSSNRSKTTEIYLSNHQLFIQNRQLFTCIIMFFWKVEFSWNSLFFFIFSSKIAELSSHIFEIDVFCQICWISMFLKKNVLFFMKIQFFVFSSKFPEFLNYFEILNFLGICYFFCFFWKTLNFFLKFAEFRIFNILLIFNI